MASLWWLCMWHKYYRKQQHCSAGWSWISAERERLSLCCLQMIGQSRWPRSLISARPSWFTGPRVQSQGHKTVWWQNGSVYRCFSVCCDFSSSALSWSGAVRFCQGVDDSGIPGKPFATLPWNECHPIRASPIRPGKSSRLLCSWEPSLG